MKAVHGVLYYPDYTQDKLTSQIEKFNGDTHKLLALQLKQSIDRRPLDQFEGQSRQKQFQKR